MPLALVAAAPWTGALLEAAAPVVWLAPVPEAAPVSEDPEPVSVEPEPEVMVAMVVAPEPLSEEAPVPVPPVTEAPEPEEVGIMQPTMEEDEAISEDEDQPLISEAEEPVMEDSAADEEGVAIRAELSWPMIELTAAVSWAATPEAIARVAMMALNFMVKVGVSGCL